VNRVGVHQAKNPLRMRSVQAVVNQWLNVPVNQKSSNSFLILGGILLRLIVL
jgi:hypothetical protein